MVVAARPLAGDRDSGAWLSRLGWTAAGHATTIELPPLSRDALAEALHGVGAPAAWQDRENLDRLWYVTEGDPLLVRLYVDLLRDQRSAADSHLPLELPLSPPGIDGYFVCAA